MRFIIVFLLLLTACYGAVAQDNFLKDYAPVAPTAASLGKYGDIPVSYNTGVPDISIPIYTLTEGGVSLPISVSYHSSGIRVQETASWVGLGWALNAGGIITRTVQNSPDEGNVLVNQQTGYYKNYGHPIVAGNITSCQDIIAAADGLIDTEPDVFSFNIGGYAGKFVFDKNRQVHTFPESDVKIVPSTSTDGSGRIFFDGWVVTDPQGTRYHFARTTDNPVTAMDFIETTASSTDFSIAGSWVEVRSSWYLSKIESADRKDYITFSYTPEKYSFWTMGGAANAGGITSCLSASVSPALNTRITGKRLASVVGTNGSVYFIGDSSPRQDLNTYVFCNQGTCLNTEAFALKTIEVRAKNGTTCIRKFDFNTSYNTSATTTNVPATAMPPTGNTADCKRLILNSITESDCNSTTNNKTHTFEYYELSSMPRRFSFAQDHWGYYNGSNNTSFLPQWPYTKTPCNGTCGYPNYAHKCLSGVTSNRESAFPAMRAATLKKITYPTGGSSTFDFDANTYLTTDTTCTETSIDAWSSSTGSCNNGTFNTRTYTFTPFQISNGHFEIKWSNPFYIAGSCATSGSVYLEVYLGSTATGIPIASISTGGNNAGPSYGYAALTSIGGVQLLANTTYTFKLINTNGIGEFSLYTLTRTPIQVNKMVGGLRIKTITNADGQSTNNIVKNYSYSDITNPSLTSGKLIDKPIYVSLFNESINQYFDGNQNLHCTFLDNTYIHTTCNPPNPALPYAYFSASSIQPMQTTLGSHIGYQYVEESETGNGKHRMFFNMGGYGSPWSPTGYPLTPPPFNPMLGKMEWEEFYGENGLKISQKLYDYNSATISLGALTDVMKVTHYLAGVQQKMYYLQTGYALPQTTTARQYAPNGTDFVETITSIAYNISAGHYQKTTEDITNSDGTIYRTKYKYSKDFPCPGTGACASTNAEMNAIYEMRARNMVAIPIEQTSWLKKSGASAFQLTAANYFRYDMTGGSYDNMKLKEVYQLRTATPIATFVETSGNGTSFTKSPDYKLEYNFVYSGINGKLLSQWKQFDPAKQQYLWGYNQKLPVAKVVNAESTEIAFTSFEETGAQPTQNGNWTLSTASGITNTSGSATGKQAYNINTSRSVSVGSLPAGTYIVSFWYRDGQIKVNNTAVGSVAGASWTYGETTLTFAGASNTVTITGTAALTYIDELRLYPSDALMRTFSFDEQNQLLLSISDENNVTSYFDYDSWQRLQAVRDQDRNILQTYEYNYQQAGTALNDVKSRTVLASGQSTIAQVNALTGANVKRVFQYLDGLGRSIETNEIAQSPTGLDIISLSQYDVYGRENKKYLPYTITSNNGAFRPISSATTEQANFANTYGAGGYGYAQTEFEPSPLNRIKEQGAPGTTWRTGQGANAHTMRYLYRNNTAADDIRDFTNATTFAPNMLSVVEETDENNRLKISFTDKMGRIVCVKQQMVDVPATPPGITDFACTYTIYDDFGRVAYVIPPETYRFMKANGSWTYSSAFYTPMEFKYTYDARGRLSVKNVPSGGAITISYDKLDRPVLTRDANSVATYTRYDILGRPVMIGNYTGFATPADTDPLYETPAANANGYTTTCFPTDNLTQLYKVMYYDHYDLDRNGSISAAEGYTNPSEAGYETFAFLRTRGKATAAKTAILKNDGTAPTVYLTARTYYDKEYAVIQVNKQNHLSGSDVVSNGYDFANRLVKTRRDHTATVGGSAKSYTTREEYVYDDASRLRFTRHKINTGNWVVTSAPVYDEMGRLKDKRLQASNYDGTSALTLLSSFNYLQSVDYTYNIRNWLTGINDPTSCNLQSGDNLQDLFSLQLNYETAVNGSTPQYNGNISSMQWNTYLNGVCGQRRLYMFSYDAANRLTAAAHRTWSGAAWTDPGQYNESGITYDLNGNIKSYNRQGLIAANTYGNIDLLAYTYGDTQRPDRLTKVVDTGNTGKGFKYNPPATGNHYAYDAVGNMTTDNHKKTTITYNYLNLPIVITFTDGTNRKIEWVYDADGTKLTKTTSTGAAVNGTKDYVGGIEYNGTNLEAIYFAEGRITPNGTAFFYEYNIKDHLGNARVAFRANGTSATPIQENHYYPFGLEMEGVWLTQIGTENGYQYNGKEYNEDYLLNWYDYGARCYDPALGRWNSIDPLGELYFSHSTYTYVTNNPVIFVDPSGMSREAFSFDNLNNEISKYNEGIKNQDKDFLGWLDNSTQKPQLKDSESGENSNGSQPRLGHDNQGSDFSQDGGPDDDCCPEWANKYLPIWSSGRSAYLDWQKGDYGWFLFDGAMTISDIFLFKSIVLKGGTLLYRGGVIPI